MKSVAAKLNF